MKILPLLFWLLVLCQGASGQKADLDIHVSKPKAITIQPDLTELHSGYTYDFIVSGLAVPSVGEVQATFGSVFSKASQDGKSLQLKVTVMGSASSIGKLTIIDNKNKILISREYKIVAKIRYTDYVPNAPASVKRSPVILFLGKDTMVDNGTISARKLKEANTLSLFDSKIPPAAIRRNLMCKITITHDSTTIIARSALNYLSGKVKQTLARAQPGDRICISAMETLWIDADRSDHITPYGDLTYTLTVSE